MLSFEKTVLHVDMDAFFVSVEEVLNPALKGRAVIVGGDPNGRGVVAAASYAARKFGVHSAMPLATARRLCPQAVFLRGNHSAYAEFSSRIFAILDKYSPCVEPVSVDEAYLDLTGCERLHGPVLSAAEKMRNEIKSAIGINASIGIAANKLVAKVASDYAKPSGMLWIVRGKEQKFLSPLPVEHIPGIGPKTGERLKSRGIKTVGQIAKLSRERLEKIFGPCGSEIHLKACGQYDSPVIRRDEQHSISRETTFDTDSSDSVFLLSTLGYLTEKVASQLRESGRYARSVTIKLRYADFQTFTRCKTLAESTCDDSVIFRTATDLFRKLFSPQAAVRLIGVGLSSLDNRELPQMNLFEMVNTEQRNQLYRGIDKIRARHGFRAILKGSSFRSGD